MMAGAQWNSGVIVRALRVTMVSGVMRFHSTLTWIGKAGEQLARQRTDETQILRIIPWLFLARLPL